MTWITPTSIVSDKQSNNFYVLFLVFGCTKKRKAATLKPGGCFKHYVIHKVQSLEAPSQLLADKVYLRSYQIVKGTIPTRNLIPEWAWNTSFIKEKNEKLDFDPFDVVVLLYVALFIINFRFGDLNNCTVTFNVSSK